MPLYPEASRSHEASQHLAVVTHLEHAWNFVSRHAVRIGIGIGALLVISGLAVGTLALQQRGDTKARELLWKGWGLSDDAERTKIFEDLSGDRHGLVAFYSQMELGRGAFEKKEFESGLGHFIEAKKLAGPGSVHESLASYAIVAANESLGRHDEALVLLEGLAQSKDPHVADRALFQKGGILELKGESDQAADIYRKLALGEEYLDSPFREEAVERLLWLAASRPAASK